MEHYANNYIPITSHNYVTGLQAIVIIAKNIIRPTVQHIHILRQGMFTCVGWQVTLCDPIWEVTLCSSEMGFLLRAISLPLTFNP